jgi:O-antigen ligase
MSTLTFPARSFRAPAVAGPLLKGPLPVWIALYVNVMPFRGLSILPIPQPLGQAVAQGMLLVALLLALLANPGLVVRPNVFLTLLTAMAVLAVTVSLHNEFLVGSSYRALRLVLFVLVLWVLTPWWGRPDLPLLRAPLLCLRVILALVLLGALVAPGAAFSFEGRLSGVIWPVVAPQVAHYAAVLLGCTAVLWFTRVVTGRTMLVTLAAAGAALVATHTRTALLGLVLGLVVAGASLFVGHARVRRTTVVALLAALAMGTVFSPLIVSWLTRGQSSQDLSQLTGRTKVWEAVAERQATTVQQIFGTGLGDKSFGGLPIDSNWVATNVELGRVGVALVVAFLLVLVLAAFARPAGPRRAIALLLVVYCVTASYTETGLGDASPYLLDLTVAASLVAVPAGIARRSRAAGDGTARWAGDLT